MAKLRGFTGHEPIIGGKQYRFAGGHATKTAADKQAAILRRGGHSARVRHFKGGYAVFTRG